MFNGGFTWRPTCASAQISLNIYRKEKRFEEKLKKKTKQKCHVPYNFSVSITVSEIIKQRMCYKYIFELSYSAINVWRLEHNGRYEKVRESAHWVCTALKLDFIPFLLTEYSIKTRVWIYILYSVRGYLTTSDHQLYVLRHWRRRSDC
jgi:hypothetical protein